MASEVDICNLALSHIGDSAIVASINPPDGSAQADLCKRFYPMARDALLEMHNWGFATRRRDLAQLVNPITEWAYCYAAPADLLGVIAIQSASASDDVGDGSSYTAQPMVLESADDGNDVIFTNVPDARLRYTVRVTDTTRFSPLFTDCLSWSLASMLAGPIIKGEAGQAEAARCQMIAFGRDGKSGKFALAAESDASDKRMARLDTKHASWITAR